MTRNQTRDSSREADESIDRNNRKEIFGWIVYDWANSAFYTTVVAALFGEYLTRLAQASVGENGVIFHFGPLLVTAKSLAPFTTSVSVFLQVFLLPILGALGDFGGGLLLALNLIFVSLATSIGVSQGMAVRLSLLSAGVWWGGFSIITFKRLRDRPASKGLPKDQTFFTIGFTEVFSTFRE